MITRIGPTAGYRWIWSVRELKGAISLKCSNETILIRQNTPQQLSLECQQDSTFYVSNPPRTSLQD